jgi:hypothetical protein
MPVVGGFKHALVSDGTGLNVDNSAPAGVRFTLESGHVQCISRCLLRATSGHRCSKEKTALDGLSEIHSLADVGRQKPTSRLVC